MTLLRIPFLFLVLGSWLQAGSGPAFIEGRSGTGRTVFFAEVGDISGSVARCKLTIDGKSWEIVNDRKDRSFQEAVVYAPKLKVYTMLVKNNDEWVEFVIVPASLERKSRSLWKFRARIHASDPRDKTGWKGTPEIELFCTLRYEI